MPERPHFLKDLEVREIQSLDHAQLAKSLFAGICLSSPPFRLALFGPWGSGKTTILKLVESEVGQRSEKDDNEIFFRSVWFNAWDHESNANLFYSLTQDLVSSVPDGVRYSKKGSRVVRRLLEGSLAHGRRWSTEEALGSNRPGQQRGPSGEPDSLGVEAIRADLERLTEMMLVAAGKKREKRLVIFVDDLDKCLPAHALAFLESIKLFFSRQAQVVLVCSIDESVLRRAVYSKYGHPEPGFAESYIEKVFEFSFQVPGISTLQISGLVDEIYRRSGLGNRDVPAEQRKMERRVIEDVMGRSGLSLNPRRIKRIFNRFVWFVSQQERLDENAAVSDDALEPWLTWLLATEYWRGLRDFIGRHGEHAFRELGNRVTGHPLLPHSSEACKTAFSNIEDSRALIEFMRGSISMPTDAHRQESQDQIRKDVLRFEEIDQLLRTLGI